MIKTKRIPLPGDSITSRVSIRAWETIDYRGSQGSWIKSETMGLVLSTLGRGNQYVMHVLINDHIIIFSTKQKNLSSNWRVNE